MTSLQDLIPVVNKLQDIVTSTALTDLDLPILTVVGSQSAGKSSVLENIVGKDFLPRGTGIVTRRPLILQLINISENKTEVVEESASLLEHHLNPNSVVEYGEFLHIPNKKFYDFNEITREIENETARIAGKNKGISRNPINLKIYSPNVLNLTLVDLPGLTKIPIGDQPTDIERQIKNLILEYISKPNSIILAVSPANQDLVNSESLKLARQVDPQGKRTIGILSKLDLMDQGTNALDILIGKVYPLKLGFIGVVNRSQQDISVNKSLNDSLQSEKEFFLNHPAYKSIANKCGTEYLAKTLNKTLMNHIRDRLPDIKAKLNTLMGQTEQELLSYGDDLNISSKENRGSLILQLMNKFANNFINSIEGNSSDISTKELCGGARIYYIYNEVLDKSLLNINPLQNLTVTDIRTAIRNSTGPRASLFVPELAFDLLVKPQIKLLEIPSHRCVELVYEELMKICHNCGSQELLRYPKLHTNLIEVVSELLRERLGPTTKYVESLIEINRAYINTNHPNFIGAADAMTQVALERQRHNKKKLIDSDAKKEKDPARIAAHNAQHVLNNNSNSNPQHNQHQQQQQQQIQHSTSNNNNNIQTQNQNQNQILNELKHFESESGSEKGPNDNFLSYFFGQQKSESNDQKHQMQLQQQLHNDIQPFKYPQESSTLQFNLSSNENSIENELERLTIDENKLSEREQLECELIRRLIASYFSIVRETIRDQVPKAIMCLLVNFTKDSVQNQLVQKLYKESLFDELLFEDENLIQEREKCQRLLQTYKDAAKVISDVV